MLPLVVAVLASLAGPAGAAAVAGAPQGAGAAAAAPQAALAAHYPFEEGSGTTTADTSGTGKPDGTLASGVTWNTTGALGRSLSFAGASPAAVTIPTQVVDTSRSFTVSAWARITTTTSYNTAVCISGAAVCNFYLQLRQDTGNWAFTVEPGDSTGQDPGRAQASATGTVQLNQWYQLVGVQDTAARTVSLYVNGTLQQTVPYAFTPWRATGSTYVGRGTFNGAVDWWHGSVDDVKLYDGVLSAAEIQTLAGNARYDYEEGAGTTTADLSGNGNDATLHGEAGFAGGIVGGSALGLDGTSGFADAPSPVIDTTQSFSVSTWVNLSRVQGTSTAVSLDGNDVSAFYLQYRPDADSFAFTREVADDAGADPQRVQATATTTVRAGQWYHLAGVYDSVARTIALYVNGTLADTKPYTASWQATGHLVVGRGRFQAADAGFFPGRIDDTRVLAFPLSGGQVQLLATSGAWSFDENGGTVAHDASPNGLDGTLRGATWTTGAVGSSAVALTPGADVTMGAAPQLDFGTRSFSLASWFRTAERTGQRLVSKGFRSFAAGYALESSDAAAPGHVTLGIGGGGKERSVLVGTTGTFSDGQWHQADAVVDALDRTVTLYVDGQAQPLAKVPGTCGTVRGATLDTAACTQLSATSGDPFVVGGDATGDVDEVRAYAFAISAAQARALAHFQTLTVDSAHPGHAVSKTLYGEFFEEINYAGVGGLYAELVRNRAFMEGATTPAWWTTVQDGGGSASATIDPGNPLNAKLTRSLKLLVDADAAGQRVGVANGGYFGVPVVPGRTYRASFYAKASGGFTGPLTLSLENADGSQVSASARVTGLTSEWKRFTATLEVPSGGAASTGNRFVVGIDNRGADPTPVASGTSVWLQVVSLFPPTYKKQPNGLRPDLVDKLAALHPKFLRFPGGNYVEGTNAATYFNWKSTVGPISERPGHLNSAWNYWSDDGLGLFEYLRLCEDLGATPVIGVFAGLFLGGGLVPQAELGPYVRDALDEIEYAIGPATSTWGARRAADGHPAPFPTPLVEIGNEDNLNNGAASYDAYRYPMFYDAIKAAYPQVTTIATTNVTSRPVEVIDEHYYSSASFFASQANRYDAYDRKGPKVFVGEYAARTGATNLPTGILGNSIGEAAFMTGMERNSDVVVMHSYAPLLVYVNHQQWSPDLIGFDGLRSFGSTSYWVQQLFAANVGDKVLPTSADGAGLYYSATVNGATGKVYLKVVNPSAGTQLTRLGFSLPGASKAAVQVLSGPDPNAGNTLANPDDITPRRSVLRGSGGSFRYAAPPNSLTVVTVEP